MDERNERSHPRLAGTGPDHDGAGLGKGCFGTGDPELAVHVAGVVLGPALHPTRRLGADASEPVGEMLDTVDSIDVPADVVGDGVAFDDLCQHVVE